MNSFRSIQRFEVVSRVPQLGFEAKKETAAQFYGLNIENLQEIPFFKVALEGETTLPKERVESLFFDSVLEDIFSSNYTLPGHPTYTVEIEFLPGVTDNTGRSAEDALQLIGGKGRVFSGQLILVYGVSDRWSLEVFARENFANPLIQKIEISSLEEFERKERFEKIELPIVEMDHGVENDPVALDISEEALESLSQEWCLALTLSEMKVIRDYFLQKEVQRERSAQRLAIWPTKLELEVIAQTWSEHCKHKIFASHIEYTEGDSHSYQDLPQQKIKGLYQSFIKQATREVEKKRGLCWLRSVFSDNAGIVRFDQNIDLCIKVETHNSPSALDPYGGALTGILGVNRDILGCGLGARPIANTDVFCFGSTELPYSGEEELMPAGLMEPKRLLAGVHRGVEDGGNKSGIPTINGAILFDDDYAGKPLVFCGTVGVMPQQIQDGRETTLKGARPGDFIVVVGGAVGADGIHGATFSSLELNESSPVTAVQIGDPITQKRVSDFLIEARDRGLYSCVTDNGAGGLSSSVGEMATLTCGARLDLQKCPLKYPGLSPWEIMISESQERMTLAVPKKDREAFLELAGQRGVVAHLLGEFTDSGFLEVFFGEQLVGRLDLDFLHNGLPPMKLLAKWDGPRGNCGEYQTKRSSWKPLRPLKNFEKIGLSRVLPELLRRENIASKAHWVKQYDHEVQAATHIKPFVGEKQQVPGDSGVIWLAPHGGDDSRGVAIGCGLAPRVSLFDPYLMAQYSVDEAVRNVVASGGDLDHLCLLDNFCWPDPIESSKNPDGAYKLGQLVRTCQGLYDICVTYGTPLVSGKDSMKNDFRGVNKKGEPLLISILPTLLVTAMARVEMSATTTSEFQKPGDIVYRLGGKAEGSLLGSELAEMISLSGDELSPLESLDLKLNTDVYRELYRAMSAGWIQSCHDISDGGLLCALCEGLFNGGVGLDLAVEMERALSFLFHEGPGRFVVSVSPENVVSFEKAFQNLPFQKLGTVWDREEVVLETNNQRFHWNVPELYQAWERKW